MRHGGIEVNIDEAAEDGDVHVMPEIDNQQHQSSRRCWCRPQRRQQVAELTFWHHNSRIHA